MSHTKQRAAGYRPGSTKDRPPTGPKRRELPPASFHRLTRLLKRLELEPAWIKVLPVNPIPIIFHRGPVGVRLRLLNLLAAGSDGEADAVIRELRRAASDSPETARILQRQRKDGTLPVETSGQPEGAVMQPVVLGLLENLHALVDLGGRRGWPGVGRGLRALLRFQHEDGRFPLSSHHHACIGRLLMALGLGRNPAVHRAAHWILERQREDGGWLHPGMAGKRRNPPSCIWTTAEVLAFIARYPTMRIKERLQQAGEFLLEHALQPNTTTLLPDAVTWNVLEEGSRGVQLFHGGTLKVLDGLTLAGFNPSHSVFKKLYTWLLEQQLEGGYYPRISGRDATGDPLVTVRALEVIYRVETTRPG